LQLEVAPIHYTLLEMANFFFETIKNTKMKQVKKMSLIMAIVSLPAIFMLSCKQQEENNENKSLTNNSNQSAFFVQENGVEKSATKLLLDFWSNYAVHKGVTDYASEITPNINAPVSAMDAVYTAHYALNSGMVYPDSVYENVIEDSFDISMPVSAQLTVTKKQICLFVDEAVTKIKTSYNLIEVSGESAKALNRLELVTISTGSSNWLIRLRWRASVGKLYSVGNMAEYPNSAAAYFTASIPWLSKESYKGTAQTYLYRNENYFTWLLYGTTSSPSHQQCVDSWAVLPNGKAAHHKLSNRNIFWPDPIRQVSSNVGFAFFPGYKAVKTPDGWYNGKYVRDVKVQDLSSTSPLKQIIATDVFDCSNPNVPGMSIIPTSGNMIPSKLLGWYGSENYYGLTGIRNVTATSMNYFWTAKKDLVILGQQRASSSIAPNMAALKSGYYALTDLNISHNPDLIGNCITTNCGDLCLYKADYRAWFIFAHYTTQPKTPKDLQLYF
jgi:hypothetical protein